MKTEDIPIGAKVSFDIAGRRFVGRVLQDRGPIGIGGRHLFLVRYEAGKGNWYSTELPADDLQDIEYNPANRRKQREVEYIIPVLWKRIPYSQGPSMHDRLQTFCVHRASASQKTQTPSKARSIFSSTRALPGKSSSFF